MNKIFFSEGKFHKDYDRPLVKKSIISFLKDPKGDLPWDEVILILSNSSSSLI